MNILFLTSTLPRFDGDQQAPFVMHQAAAWKAARPDDEVRILAPHDVAAAKIEIKDGVTIQRFKYFWPNRMQRLAYPAILPNLRRNRLLWLLTPFFLVAEYFAAVRVVREHQVEAVYAHWVMPQGLIAYLIHKRTGTPYTLQNHSSDLTVFSSSALGRKIARRIVAAAKVFFCVNREQRNSTLALFPEKCRDRIAEKCFVYPMGVSLSQSSDDSSSCRIERDFGIISRLSKKKGIEHFIAALEKLNSKKIRFRAGIAGDGEYASELKNAGVDSGAEFLGFLSGNKKSAFLNSTRFFVFPSVIDGQDVEGMPVALLEALFLGKLVVASPATNIQLLPEWSEISEGVIILSDVKDPVRFAQALEQLISMSDEDIGRISSVLRKSLAKYEWSNLIHQYIDPVVA